MRLERVAIVLRRASPRPRLARFQAILSSGMCPEPGVRSLR